MDLAHLRPVYAASGPFATVYLESRPPSEDADTQIRLRWQELREDLAEREATPEALDSLEEALFAEQSGEAQADGRVLVATDAGVVLHAAWDAALGAGDSAHWSQFPELGAYVREWARSVRMLVVLADQEEAQLRREVMAEQHSPREVRSPETVSADTYEGVHKPRGGALAHKRIQRRADEAVKDNAKEITSRMSSIAAVFHPRVVAIGGEAKARAAIRDQLSADLTDMYVEIEHGRSPEEVLNDELAELAGDISDRHSQQLNDQFQEALAHENAVQGQESVTRAAEIGAVDVLLFEAAAPAANEAFLLKACTETSSQFDVLPAGTDLTDGVGAILRFPLPAS